MDDADKRASGASEQTPPKIKAEDNPWYMLATLFGVPREGDQDLKDKNRVAWNRYFAANLDEETRTRLIQEQRHSKEELTPFSQAELQEVKKAFAERWPSANGLALHVPNARLPIIFSNVEFEQDASFQGYLFGSLSDFNRATFSRWAAFDGTTFLRAAHFDKATFCGWTIFDGATFCCMVLFDGATCSGLASFRGVAFRGTATFDDANLWAIYDGAIFLDRASFHGAIFSGPADFGGATFFRDAFFRGVTFSSAAGFRNAAFREASSFVNAEMKGETTFERAVFKTEPPNFFGAELHQGTVWRGIKWPPKPKDKKEAGAFIDAYACLKLEMDRLKKHEDELDFFALELQSRRVYLGSWRGLPFALYGLLSDYGRSYLRPLVALFMVAVIGAGAFWYFDARLPWEALGLSAANTLNVFGFRRDFNLAIDTPFAWLKVFAAVQTILGTILLFFFGLGIRNKFRMK